VGWGLSPAAPWPPRTAPTLRRGLLVPQPGQGTWPAWAVTPRHHVIVYGGTAAAQWRHWMSFDREVCGKKHPGVSQKKSCRWAGVEAAEVRAGFAAHPGSIWAEMGPAGRAARGERGALANSPPLAPSAVSCQGPNPTPRQRLQPARTPNLRSPLRPCTRAGGCSATGQAPLCVPPREAHWSRKDSHRGDGTPLWVRSCHCVKQ